MGPLTWDFLSWDWVVSTVIVELAVVFAGVLIANYYIRWRKEKKWGKWNLVIRHGEDTVLDRSLSAGTTERIFSDETDLDVFLKGRVSVFGDVHCDLVSELKKGKSQVIEQDNAIRTITMWMGNPYAEDKIGIVPRSPADNQEPIL